jgi:predicted ATPase with chaperone activity
MAIAELNFSARAYDRILKAARTITSVEDAESLVLLMKRTNTRWGS